jgi:hypothetical protein
MLIEKPPLRGIPFGTLELDNINPDERATSLRVGDQVTGKIVRLLPGGAVVLVADYCPVFLPANTTMPGKGFLGKILQCGDAVEGVVTHINEHDQANMKGTISFSRLAEASVVSRQNRDPLIDIMSKKTVGMRGGFARDSAFRLSVIEANARICCFCGLDFSVGAATAMEAAHIIPRGKRGADSVSNGLCMCPVHHWAFDRGLWSLDQSMVIQVASEVRKKENKHVAWLVDFHGKDAIFPLELKASAEAIDWHRRNVYLDADEISKADDISKLA